MKRTKRSISIFLTLTLIMTMLAGMTVFADDDGNDSDDEHQAEFIYVDPDEVTIVQGQKATVRVYTNWAYDIFDDSSCVGTYGQEGSGYAVIYIDSNEPVRDIHFTFHIEDGTGDDDVLTVHLKAKDKPTPPPQPSQPSQPSAADQQAQYMAQVQKQFPYGFEFVPTSDGQKGIAVLDATRRITSFYRAGVPLAQFTVVDANGIAYPVIFTNPISYGGMTFIGMTVVHPANVPLTVVMSSVSKQMLNAQGIYGVLLNGALVMWP
jgi:hypothetical protein